MNKSDLSRTNRSDIIKDEWPILISLIAVSILYSLLAQALAELVSLPYLSSSTIRLISLALSGTLVFMIAAGWLAKQLKFSRFMLIVLSSVVTMYLFSGVYLLVGSLPNLHGTMAGLTLLRDTAIVWIINILIFAIWFWIMDGGGPARRRKGETSKIKDFLFSQEEIPIPGWEHWHPNYLDYFFMSLFSCSTFGPTDVRVLSRRAKLLIAMEAVISLLTLTMFVARALSLIT